MTGFRVAYNGGVHEGERPHTPVHNNILHLCERTRQGHSDREYHRSPIVDAVSSNSVDISDLWGTLERCSYIRVIKRVGPQGRRGGWHNGDEYIGLSRLLVNEYHLVIP